MAYVADRYGNAGHQVRIGYGNADRWCKADAVRDAIGRSDGDILVVADADVWSDHLDESIDAVRAGAGWATPHWHVNRLTEQSTVAFVAGERDDLALEEDHHGVAGGGITVLRRDMYERVPLDPRFVGWGGEDKAWAYALRTLAGRAERVRQPLWHFWHPPQRRMTRAVGSPENDALRAAYADSSGQPRRMRELIAEGRAWASNGSSSKT